MSNFKDCHRYLGIVRLFYGKVVDEDSVSYNRFITHIQYFAQRVVNGVIQGKNDSFLYEQVKLNYPVAFSCSEKLKLYRSSYDFPMSRDEQFISPFTFNAWKPVIINKNH